jgi:hypothetical protein
MTIAEVHIVIMVQQEVHLHRKYDNPTNESMKDICSLFRVVKKVVQRRLQQLEQRMHHRVEVQRTNQVHEVAFVIHRNYPVCHHVLL